jgi:hypothetical protein
MSPSVRGAVSVIIMILVPVVLVLTAVRVVLSPWFLEFEYRTPNFPPDRYGFHHGRAAAICSHCPGLPAE